MTVLKLGESLKTFFTNLNANFLEISGKLTHSPVSVKQIYSGVGASGTPVAVFRANGSNYERVIAGLEVQGGYAVITASEAFAGYVRCI